MLHSLQIRGYRSLLDFRLTLGRVTLVTGGNGVGKSNLYRSLAMMQRLAEGRFAEAVAAEGGMPSLLWSGPRTKDPLRVKWNLEHDFFKYSMECGLIPVSPGNPTMFRTDPDIKLETLHLHQGGKGHVVAKRSGLNIQLRNRDNEWDGVALPILSPESMLGEVRDGARYPGLAAAREILLSWRFYHQFRTDADSLLRRPVVGACSPILAHDGANLAATLQTIEEMGNRDELESAIHGAFPGIEWRCVDDSGRFQLQVLRSGVRRWLNAAELSDGTLRFFCLCAALLSPKPPPLLVLNEPENSLHPDLMPALAGLIAQARENTQILVVTHSKQLDEAISEFSDIKKVSLINHEGETRHEQAGTARKVYYYDDVEEM